MKMNGLPDNTNNSDRLLKPAKAAQLLDISTGTLWRLRGNGQIPEVRIGGSIRFRLSDLQRLMAEGISIN